MNRNDDLSENLRYTVHNLPILTSDEHLSELPTFRELMHWHDDYEFILVTSGTLDFDINGDIIQIHENQGLFINSGRLHYGFSKEKKEVLFRMVIVSSKLICNSFNSDILNNLGDKNNINYLMFHKNMPLWSILESIYHINQKREKNYLLSLQSELCLLVKELCLLCTYSENNLYDDMSVMKQMINFIKVHYSEKISVSDIAASAMICRNKCFKIFQKFMRLTPQQYLIQYRISKSIEMMCENIHISEIAQACGFCSQSHYIKSFRDLYEMTPKQYKNLLKNN